MAGTDDGSIEERITKAATSTQEQNPDALVFEDANVNLRKLWTAAYAEAKVPKGTRMFYSVRHAFATEMANSGMPMPALARLLGHSSVDMTFRYYNLDQETLNKARNILNKRAMING